MFCDASYACVVAAGSDSVLYVFSDLTQTEIVVASAFVQECADISSGLERLGAYELHDMVMLDRTQVGVVVKQMTATKYQIKVDGQKKAVEAASKKSKCGGPSRVWLQINLSVLVRNF